MRTILWFVAPYRELYRLATCLKIHNSSQLSVVMAPSSSHQWPGVGMPGTSVLVPAEMTMSSEIAWSAPGVKALFFQPFGFLPLGRLAWLGFSWCGQTQSVNQTTFGWGRRAGHWRLPYIWGLLRCQGLDHLFPPSLPKR